MTVTVKATVEAEEGFEPGQCMDCPFSMLDNEFNYICPFGWFYDECKVEVAKDDID